MVGGLWKIVREAVISDGKVTVTALTFQWWGPNYIEGPFFFSLLPSEKPMLILIYF